MLVACEKLMGRSKPSAMIKNNTTKAKNDPTRLLGKLNLSGWRITVPLKEEGNEGQDPQFRAEMIAQASYDQLVGFHGL